MKLKEVAEEYGLQMAVCAAASFCVAKTWNHCLDRVNNATETNSYYGIAESIVICVVDEKQSTYSSHIRAAVYALYVLQS